jgi:large subunit ribosomal protein L3
MKGLIGRKMGMTQVSDGQGRLVAVTVIEAGPCAVIQRKTKASDGYDAVQLGFGDQKEQRVTKPAMARFKKVKAAPKRVLKEFRLDDGEEIKEGAEVTAAMVFEGTSHVDVTGLSKGRGFAGVVRRYRMAGGRMTHGGHSKRRIGSIGQCSYPARVVKGKRMPGHMGAKTVTTQNLEIVELRGDDNLLLIRGAVPGPTGSIVLVRKSIKKQVPVGAAPAAEEEPAKGKKAKKGKG